MEVLNGEIDNIIDQSVEKMKEEIWVCMAESHEFEERERKGGSLASLTGQKKDEDEWIEQKEDEDDTSNVEQKEDEDEEEEIFLDVIRKDAEKLGEMINELSQNAKFNDKATEIKALMNLYFNDKHVKTALYGGKPLLRTKAIDDVIEILKSPLRESETIALASRMYVLVQKIENTRELIKRLFWIMEIENEEEKDNALIRMRLNGITDQEYKDFVNELTPESVSRVLKARET